MSETPSSHSSSPHPLYSLPHLNRSASSYNSAENGFPDGPEMGDTTLTGLAKGSAAAAPNVDSPTTYQFERNREKQRVEENGAIDLGDGEGDGPTRAQRFRETFRTHSDDGGVGLLAARDKSGQTSSPGPSAGLARRQASHGPSISKGLTPQRVGRIVGTRVMKTVKRGNLPFMIVFLSCLVIFFSALAGVGYVPEDGEVPTVTGAARLAPAQLSYEETQMLKGRKNDEQRELEREWARKKRPKDGAWMAQYRDDKAIRRKPVNPDNPVERDIEGQVVDVVEEVDKDST